MSKYIFNKDYETQVRISDNGTSTGTKQVKIPKGTSIEGQLVEGSELISLVYNGNKLSVDKSYLDLNIPYNGSGINPKGLYSMEDNNKGVVAVDSKGKELKGSIKKASISIFTTKNIVIATIVVGGVIYFLKHKNII